MIPLLSTKLNLPPLRLETVFRPRLVECLNNGLLVDGEFGRRLTLVAAPAGYGKTTLVLDWIKRIGLPIAWLSLDETDNDPRRFFTYLIATMQQVDTSIGQVAIAMLQSPQPPPDEPMLTSLANEIVAIQKPFIFILDDYHVISTQPIHRQLTFLLEHQPANLHMVITTREDPLLPIPRLRVRNQVLEIRQDDLRFTAGETADFLKNVMALNISSNQISALERHTEGWIAGLQMAALSMRGRDDLSGFIQAFTGSNRFILDYLIEEVFERQSPDVKGFLLKTSILERLSGSLCNAVTGKTDSQNLLEMLDQSNLFIIPLDQSRTWYRYHRLFAELLRHRLRSSSFAENELHQRASQWYEKNDLPPDAIRHSLATQNWGRTANLISANSELMLKRGEILTLIGWFKSLPEEMLFSNPKLCFDYCWSLLLAGQFEVARPLLEQVERMAVEKPDFLGEVYAAQAYHARGIGDHERMVERSQRALKLLPKSSINSRGLVAINLGIAYWHMGQMPAAEETLNEALEMGQATDNHYAVLTTLIFLGRIWAVRGQLHQATEYFMRAIQQGGEIPINALAYMDLATLHYEWNELEVSDIHLQKAITLCQQSQNYEFLVGSLMIQSRLRVAQNDIDSAEKALEQAWELVHSGKIPAPTAARVDVAQARILLEKGKPLREWEQKLTEKVDSHPFYRFLGLTKAWTLPDAHARAYLDGLSQVAQANEWVYGLVAVQALQTVKAGTQEEALGFLAEALQMAEDGGFIRSFVEMGSELAPLLKEAARRGIKPEYVGKILEVMADSVHITKAGQSSLVEALSNREIEVLRLVSAGLSNREIAENLVISIGTAKSHVHNLCGKLGVRNRTEAAIKGKELGLV